MHFWEKKDYLPQKEEKTPLDSCLQAIYNENIKFPQLLPEQRALLRCSAGLNTIVQTNRIEGMIYVTKGYVELAGANL